MTSLLLASRTVRRYRAQTVLAIVGVAVIGALLFDMLLLSHGLLLSFSDLLGRAGFDVRIVGGGGFAARLPIDQSGPLIDAIRALPEVERVGAIRIQTAVIAASDRRLERVTVIGAADAAEGAWTLVRGADLSTPRRRPRRARCSSAARSQPAWASAPGSTVQLTVQPPGVRSVLPSLACRVVGVAQFAFGASSDDTVATTLDAFHRASGEADRGDADLVMVALARRRRARDVR